MEIIRANYGQLLIRGSKTFTGAANLGAVGDCPIFTTTGAVLLHGLWVRCTDDLVDAVDGALFTIGVTGATAAFGSWTAAFDLDTIDAGDGLEGTTPAALDGWGWNLVEEGTGQNGAPIIMDSITMTVSGQAITGGVLEFYALHTSLSSNGALSLGTGMVAI